LPAGASRLGDVDNGAVDPEAGSDQPAALAGAAVDRYGKLAFDDTAPVPVGAPDDTPETCERLFQFEDVLTPPPEGVSLLGERPRRFDRSVNEEKTAILGERGVAQGREQRSMTRRRIHGATQGAGPSGDCAGAVAARREPLPQVTAIGPNCRLHPRSDHPLEELPRIGRKLELQQLLPHLFLRPAQKHDIAGGSAWASENAAPEVEELVDGSEDRAATPEIIAEIYDPVTLSEPFADAIVQLGETPRLTVNDGDRPNTPGGPQPGKSSVRARYPCSAVWRGPHHPERSGGQQLFDPLGCGGLVDALDGGKLAHQPVESRLIDLPFAVGLLRLAGVTI
jgi:hypothetical protein